MALEDRFGRFAGEQKAAADQHRDPYERNVESMNKVDSIVSRVLEAFCHAVGWSLKRSDCSDRDKGAVSCNYILEHRGFWREGYVTVDVEVTRGYRSDSVEAVTVYQGAIVGTTEHARDFASKLVIPFSQLTEDGLATALEQQSRNLIRRIVRLEKPKRPISVEHERLQRTATLEDRFRRVVEAEVKAEWDRQHQEAYEKNVESLKKVEPMVSGFLEGYCSALGWNLDRHDHCTLATGVVSCCYQLSPPGLDMGHVDVWVSVTDRQEPQPELVECVEVDGGTQERTRIPFTELTKERLAAALAVQSANIISRISYRDKPQ
ncbi:MAG: hypothetical protein JW753_07665 [Dehalococcoidia bacterium]|nr:hypothetical protein [Dehalococcoidia bacterium]